MSEVLKALESASRRELQTLAKKLQLCRGNAKSNVIVNHAMQFMDDHSKDGEQQVLDALGDSGSAGSLTSPVGKKLIIKKEDESTKQPEDEPSIKHVEDESDKQSEDEPVIKQVEDESEKHVEEEPVIKHVEDESEKQPANEPVIKHVEDENDKQSEDEPVIKHVEDENDKQSEDEPAIEHVEDESDKQFANEPVIKHVKDKSDKQLANEPVIKHVKDKSDKQSEDEPVIKQLGDKSEKHVEDEPAIKHVEDKTDKQSEDEPAIKLVEDESDKQLENEPETTSSSAATSRVTPTKKDKAKSKHVPFDTATITYSTTASPSAMRSKPYVTASPVFKSFTTTDNIQPTSVETKKVDGKKKDSTATTTTAPMSKMVEIKKARKAVEALIKSVADLTFVGESRVRCSTTGHEMLADVNIINTYLHGKRYQKARNLKLSFAKYAPMFVDHPDESKTDMLWCNVTDSAIARDEKRVKVHMAAPKYQKQLSSWKQQEAAKKKLEEEENQRREARIQVAKRKRLEAAKENDDNAVVSEHPIKRQRLAVNMDK